MIDISKFDSDKAGYLKDYDEYFKHLQSSDVKLLELGIYHGGSLLMWEDYFQKGQIVGLDINDFSFDKPAKRIKIYQGDQKDTGLLSRISKENAPEGFDIIIDDASHFGLESWKSFVYLFRHHLKSGGIYVLEDWGTGYWPHYPRGRNIELDSHHLSYHLHSTEEKEEFTEKGIISKGVTLSKRRFRSHDFGLVGVVKQMIDEVGLGTATNPEYSKYKNQLHPKIKKMIVTDGQVFIYKK